jgi:hypothetical protein
MAKVAIQGESAQFEALNRLKSALAARKIADLLAPRNG